MHHTDERTHANREATPAKDALYDMLLNSYPYTAKRLARMLIDSASEADAKQFMHAHDLTHFVEAEEIL